MIDPTKSVFFNQIEDNKNEINEIKIELEELKTKVKKLINKFEDNKSNISKEIDELTLIEE